MDWAISIVMSFLLIFSIVGCFATHSFVPWLQAHDFLMNSVAMFVSLLLALWMLRGGSASILWLWMPPFCLFPKVVWIRWFVVGGMIAGTIMGIVKGSP